MNNVHNKIDAAPGAKVFGRYSFVRRLALGCVLGCAAMSAAYAGPGDKDGDAQRAAMQAQQNQRGERIAPPVQRPVGDSRQFDSRSFEARADEQRRQLQVQQDQNAQNAEAIRRSSRMTPDERRDLRRQINEAGLDLYPNTPRR
jgi:hypothetical protein